MTPSFTHLLTPEHSAFRDSARRLAEEEIAPLVDAAEANGRYPIEIVRRAGELGFLAAGYPEDVGGSGAGVSFECVLIEECAAVSAGITSGLMIQSGLATALIHGYGTGAQQAAYLLPALRGERLGCYAMTEPGAGSDVLGMRGRARREGDGLSHPVQQGVHHGGPLRGFSDRGRIHRPGQAPERLERFHR